MSENLKTRPSFVRRHGKGLANVVTEARLPLSLFNAGHTLMGKTGIFATVSNIVTDASDTVDGMLAKGAVQEGPAYGQIGAWLDEFAKRDGKIRDRKVDKEAQNVRRAALVITHVISPIDLFVPMGRDLLVDYVRDGGQAMDAMEDPSEPVESNTSSSIDIGRAKTVAMAVAFAYSATKFGRSKPESIRRAHRFCTYFSVASGAITIAHEMREKKRSRSALADSRLEPCVDTLEVEAP